MSVKKLSVVAVIACLWALPAAAQGQPDGGGNVDPAQVMKTLEGMSPQDRQQFEKSAKEKFDKLAPDEQQKIKNQALGQWQKLSPEQQKELKDAAKAQYDSLSPEEQQKMQDAAQKQWQGMSPEQQKALLQTLPPGTVAAEPTN